VPGEGVGLRARVGGAGPPLLLMHGHPQTSAMWHRVAPELARDFTVVAIDLRGYGASDKPAGGGDHAAYSKRAMALDAVGAMRTLGFGRFRVLAHDRGARVAHRLALDHPERVERMVLLDVAPTLAMYERTSMAFATAYFHWFFHIQPEPLPERLIGADPRFYLRALMGGRHAGLAPFAPEAMDEYLRAIDDPATVRAICEDYRASATIDLDHDRADRDADRRVACPLLVLWGRHGTIERCFEPLAEWRRVAGDVGGQALDCGHYVAEEAPADLLAAALPFLRAAPG
jgi:haloacetate dehalogenase